MLRPWVGNLFTLVSGPDGKVTVVATAAYLSMVSAMPNQEVGWRAYLQCRRLVTVERYENHFTEYYQDRVISSNTVWIRTPDLSPGLHLEKSTRSVDSPMATVMNPIRPFQ